MEEIKVLQKSGSIEFDFEGTKSQINSILSEYKGMIFTDDSMPIAKKEVAKIRSLQKDFDTRRKEVKKEWNKPYDEFEKKAKELIALFDEPINLINGKVQEFEEKRKAEKHEQVVAIFNEMVEPVAEYCSILKFYDEKWDNATVTITSVKKDIQTLVEKIQSELTVIKSMNSECETKALERYQTTNQLADAILFINQYEKQKSDILRMEQERKAEEERRKLEEERKASEPVVIFEEVEEQIQAFVQEPVFEKASEEPTKVFKMSLPYTIVATSEQFSTIETFLDSLGVEWSK